ncbi:efflux RND transporter permease subunit [Crenothrix polyspora]|uniref:Acriflavin resistance protein n=1 Tax=Crenothrix polyspora TaxID=360316 RepID=A0A1R4GYQ4_9GAMM|nr:efflux RND transporter permease subunit [Crenothrix polyspora]SJM89098.1 Acriflavin resistance protein [Crenothrix polyspora]
MHNTDSTETGAISWMARHGVAANVLMLICLLGGLLSMLHIKQEVFPDFQLDTISISVLYPGASPEEIESGILLAIEDAISGLEGIDEVRSTAKEGLGTILVDVMSNADIQKLAEDMRQEVSRISSLPEDAEEPKIKVMTRKRQVLSLVLYGNAKELLLHTLAEQFRDQLLQDPGITQVELEGIRPLEISIEVSQDNLRRYRLSLADIALRIQNASIDLPAGSIKTDSGEILIRMKERKDVGAEFARIPLVSSASGSEVLLGDIATINDGYKDTDHSASYNGQPAVMVQVYSVGEQTPIQVSAAVKKQLAPFKQTLPGGINAAIRIDESDTYTQRIDLLVNDGIQGLVLVFIALAIFLELRLAFWAMMGVPIAFLGAFLLLPFFNVSLNMVSLFAFLIASGIAVDDAIVIGESVYHYRQLGYSGMEAAVKAARKMAVPVTFGILINSVALVPLLFMPGEIGKIYYMLPVVVISVFAMSLVECLFILPNHLGHLKTKSEAQQGGLYKLQQRFSSAFLSWVHRRYGGLLDWLLPCRYLVIVACLALLAVTLAYVASGRMGFSLFPKTESDYARVSLTMPYGTPQEKTQVITQKIVADAWTAAKHFKGGEGLIKGVFAEIGKTDSNKAEVRVYLAPPEVRARIASTEQFNEQWRKRVGEIVSLKSIRFESDAGGPGGGSAITIELNHIDMQMLEQASKELASVLKSYTLVKDVDDGFSPGKEQFDFTLLPEGKSLGLTAKNVARQVRNAFFGAEVLRQQRGRNEIKVMVRLPEQERVSEANIDDLMIWTNSGQPAVASANTPTKEVPLRTLVSTQRGHAYTEINRHNGRRNVEVTANVSPKYKTNEVLTDLKINGLPALMAKYPGLQYSFEGQQAQTEESLGSLKISFLLSILAVYVLLAIPFQSYLLPLIVIASIPFGIIGAIFGHIVMDYSLSIVSLLGIIALSGVAVNDALVLVDHAVYLKSTTVGTPAEIIKAAATQRFRPILLTTLTSFFGLMPIILETSRQARVLIPMAISMGFGIVFSTLITLVLIPCLYMVIIDVRRWLGVKQVDEPL